MAIPDEDIARVRAATDLAALVGEHSTLKRVGRQLTGLCPFHQENSPSFSVNPELGVYYCFGCGVSGDAIGFLRAMDGVDFVEAVERLAARAGVPIRHDAAGSSTAARSDQRRRQALLDATAGAVAFYHERLLSHPDASAARHYLRSRGYDGDVVRRFTLGWAPAGGAELVRALNAPERALKEAGLAHSGTSGRFQDTFRGRVVFPIFDTSNRPIALGGRSLPGDTTGPKYRNSPESPIYAKRRTLYGLNWAKTALQHTPEVVVCEGYTDVIGFFLAEVPRAVATCGTALTEDHLKVLGSFAKRVVLAFDADAAGQSAAGRIYESERRHGLEVAVAALPAGTDPADLAREDPEALRKCVETALPYMAWRVERVLTTEDLRTPEGRVRASEAALPVIAEHPNELVRDQYLVRVADLCRIDAMQLRPRLERLRRSGAGGAAGRPGAGAARGVGERRGQGAGPGPGQGTGPGTRQGQRAGEGAGAVSGPEGPGAPGAPAGTARDRGDRIGRPGLAGSPSAREGWDPESRALALAIQRPEEMVPYLHESLFAVTAHRLAFEALSGAASLHAAVDAVEPEVADLLRRLAVVVVEDDTDGAVVALARNAAERAVADLDREARSAALGEAPTQVAELSSRLDWLKLGLGELLAAGDRARAEDARPLLAWLARQDVSR